jgi:subtilase family serine protease
VSGLSGLLAKEATVTVKYTADDLSNAGGDASRLKLARLDNGQWTVLDTNVNEGEMLLSANTNQMSVWAGVVASHSAADTAKTSSVTTVAAIAGVIVLALVVVIMIFLVRRRR